MPEILLEVGQTPQKLTSLPGAELEAQAIGKILNSQALIGAEATETAVLDRLPLAKVIHLATHGLLEYGVSPSSAINNIPGAIALTPSPEDDGLLTANEIAELNLNADLVVLSACNTGRGQVTGDGVIGLSRAFITAGTPSIIVSLWSVPDAPTAYLMTEFYRSLNSGQDKAQSLRQAMLKTMEKHPDPKDWAAFTLIGESQ